ncbi:hypothetical protein TD95_005391 [Thielaviopsis punctulata]|uniref:Velvet domain-containing protein n=1 Tax=Thielaviopsis punctulata TaxID=72032 RepID=A0A0F4ZMY5_9PEZI|nr:hypothetical protein TD95_005391 [Thielaviopsis punctulata]
MNAASDHSDPYGSHAGHPSQHSQHSHSAHPSQQQPHNSLPPPIHSMQRLPPMPTQAQAPSAPHHAQMPPMHAPHQTHPQAHPQHPGQSQQMIQSQPQAQQQMHPLAELTKVFQGRRYKLSVVQQPKRARMCGFGDKDRRPITPPPCVRLIVTDDEDGKATNDNDIPYLCFVCHVSLWSEDGTRELDIVRHSSGNPSISSTTTASFASIQESTSPAYTQMMSSRQPAYLPQMPYGSMPPYSMGYGQQTTPYMHNGYQPANTYYPNDYRSSMMPNVLGGNMSYGYGAPTPDQTMTRTTGPQGMFTRNLVGQSVVSAQRLTDTQDKVGVWFILHDLSVRTEGNFRLKFTVVNIAGEANATNMTVNQGAVPVLASCFSDAFTVFSAKKFPGVCESTALSKCFATQGIKIPIRKEGGADRNNNEEYEE